WVLLGKGIGALVLDLEPAPLELLRCDASGGQALLGLIPRLDGLAWLEFRSVLRMVEPGVEVKPVGALARLCGLACAVEDAVGTVRSRLVDDLRAGLGCRNALEQRVQRLASVLVKRSLRQMEPRDGPGAALLRSGRLRSAGN